MTDQPPGPGQGGPPAPGWWLASDGQWYPPQGEPVPPQPRSQPPAGQVPPPVPPQGQAPPPGQSWQAPPGQPPGTPPPYAPQPTPSGGNGKVIAIVAAVIGVLILLPLVAILAITFLGSSSDDDETSTAASSESVTTTEATTETTEDPDAGKSEPEARALVDELESSGAIGDLGDPDLELCVGLAVLDDPALADAMESEADIDPASPEFTDLMQILVDCGGRTFLEDAFFEGMAGSASDTELACVQDVLGELSDDELVQLFADLAAEDTEALGVILPCIEG